MFYISPFTPLFFSPSNDKFGVPSKYMQRFAPTDQIFIEVTSVSENAELLGYIVNVLTGVRVSVMWNTWKMNDSAELYYYIITGLENGYYQFELNSVLSEIFEVTDDNIKLSRTTLIQYSMKDNKQRTDCVFIIEGKQYLFDFRVPGGFRDDGWSFMVNNEQFTTPDGGIVELYSSESTQQIFTLGNAEGCPVWYAELLNRIMSCNYVFFNGKRFVRYESSVPEQNQVLEGINSYVFTISLHEIRNNDRIKFDNQFVDGAPDSDLPGSLDGTSLRLSRNINVASQQVGFIKTGDVLVQGMSYEDVFVTMLEKKDSAKLIGKLSTSREVEFGTTKGYITYTAIRNGQGVIKKAYYDGIETNVLSFSTEDNGTQTAIRQLTSMYTKGESYTATIVFTASSDGKLPEISLNDTISVNVRRKWFAGVCTTAPATSSDVRSLASSGLYTGPGAYKFNTSQWKIVAVCIPEGTVNDISIASSTGNFIENGKVCTGPVTISVEGANGSDAINYKMWIIRTEGTNDPDSFTFKTV